MHPRWQPPPGAVCRTPAADGVTFVPQRIDLFTDRPADGYDAGTDAVALCRICPHRKPCLTVSISTGERHAIMGGAGGSRRRALRRSWDTPAWPAAVAAHFRRLDGHPPDPGDAELLNAAGPGRTPGTRGSFAVGCRDDASAMAAAIEGARAKAGLPRAMR